VRRYQIISCDGRLETPPDAWLRHLPQGRTILLENPCRFFGLDPVRDITATPG
jgi:hypothetical protein